MAPRQARHQTAPDTAPGGAARARHTVHGEDTRHQDRSRPVGPLGVRWDRTFWRRVLGFAGPEAGCAAHPGIDADEDDAFLTLIESLPDGVAVTAPDGSVIAANGTCRVRLGLRAGDTGSGTEAGAEADDAALADRLAGLPEVFQAEGRWYRRFVRSLAPYGTLILIRDVTIEARQVARIETLEQDVAEAKALKADLARAQAAVAALEERVQRERARAEAAGHAMADFMANASHELRTPLNAILGFSELMNRELFGPVGHEKYKEYIGDIHASGAALLDLVTDILDMARLDGPDATVHQPARMRPGDAVKTAVAFIRHRMDAKFQDLTVDLDRLPTAYADLQSVKRILLHLLTNAVKFTPEHGSITVRGTADLHHVILSVEDTGIGIDAEDLPDLGTPFRRSRRACVNGAPGLGLGLALSRRLAEVNGGTLSLSSTPGQGTCARLVLPRRAQRSQTRPQRAPAVPTQAAIRAVS
ncbi:MAG: sensor histidine kinase [Alphaproteobacteria bacterium]